MRLGNALRSLVQWLSKFSSSQIFDPVRCSCAAISCVFLFTRANQPLRRIGKRDLIGHGSLALDPFEKNRTFVGVDLGEVLIHRPAIMSAYVSSKVHFP